MTHTIKKNITTVNKGKVGGNKPEWIVFHFVGASGQATANSNYFKSTYRGASAHYFVDPKEIVQVVEDNAPAWHIGDGYKSRKGKNNGYVVKNGATNTNSIGIEACQDTTTGKDAWSWGFHPETLNKAEWLIRKLQKQYNIDDAHVIRHFDASGKLCPGNMKDNNWAEWEKFHKRLRKDVVQPAPSAVPKNEGKPYDDDMYLVEHGDTLYAIAKQHKVSVEDLVKWNKLDDKNLILPETKLFVKPTVEVPKVTTPVKPVVQPKPAKSIDTLAREVIDGKLGTGDTRKKNLGSQYDAVQKRVNELLGAKSKTTVKAKPAGKTLNQLVDEVNRGLHGTGRDRMNSLGSRYAEVQREVNRRLK